MNPLPERIANGDLMLRRHREDDRDALVKVLRRSAASIGRWLAWCHADYGPDEAAQFIAMARRQWSEGGPYDLLVERHGRLAGCVRLRFIAPEDRMGNLGYWVDAEQQGQGIAVRASRLAARLAFESLGMVRLELVIAQGNHASRRVAEKLGAQFEYLARHRLLDGDTPITAAIYSLIPSDLD
jgi:ribosomal-protein-serine acetyltransferase